MTEAQTREEWIERQNRMPLRMRFLIEQRESEIVAEEDERKRRRDASDLVLQNRLKGFEETLGSLLADAQWMLQYRVLIPEWSLKNPLSLDHREWLGEFDFADIGAHPIRIFIPLKIISFDDPGLWYANEARFTVILPTRSSSHRSLNSALAIAARYTPDAF